MKPTIFAIAVVASFFMTAAGPAQAGPIAPISPGVTAEFDILTDVQWRRCWRDRWGRLHCRRCWRDSWGRVRCRR
jgi:hypothetical protein